MKNLTLFSDSTTIQAVVKNLATQIQETLDLDDILVLPVLSGGMIFAADLVRYLNFGLKMCPVIVSRYGEERRTDRTPQIQFFPEETQIMNQNVLIVDDIYDQGDTIECLKDACIDFGAKSVYVATLICREPDKINNDHAPDFYGFSTDRSQFYFGYGMDLAGGLRHLVDIWSVPAENEDLY